MSKQASTALNDWAEKRRLQIERAAELREQRKREAGSNWEPEPPPQQARDVRPPSGRGPSYQPDYYGGGGGGASGMGNYGGAAPDPYGAPRRTSSSRNSGLGDPFGAPAPAPAPIAPRRAPAGGAGRAAPVAPPAPAPAVDQYYTAGGGGGGSGSGASGAAARRAQEEVDEAWLSGLRSDGSSRTRRRNDWNGEFAAGSSALESAPPPAPAPRRAAAATPAPAGYTPSAMDPRAAPKRTEGINRLKALQNSRAAAAAQRDNLPPSRGGGGGGFGAGGGRGAFGGADSDDSDQVSPQDPRKARPAPAPRAPLGRPFAQPPPYAPPSHPPSFGRRTSLDDRPVSKAFGGMSIKDDGPAPYADDVNLIPCNGCGRSFNPKAYQIHQKVCAKVFQSKRRAFNVQEKRLPPEALKAAHMGGGRGGPAARATARPSALSPAAASKANAPLPGDKKAKWKKESEAFRNAMRAAKGLPPIPGSAAAGGGGYGGEPDDDFVPCPYCGRRYAQLTAERHIPKCKDIINKPGRLMRGGGPGGAHLSVLRPGAPAPRAPPSRGGLGGRR